MSNQYTVNKKDKTYGMIYPSCLAQVMKATECSVRELANYVGVQEDTVSRWRSGINQPNYPMMQRVAQYLNVEVAAIWPDQYTIGHDDQATYDALTERIGLLHYSKDYKLFQKLSSERAAISVRLTCGLSRRRTTGGEDAYLMNDQRIPQGVTLRADFH